jgi:hypothetical protein
LAIIGRVRIDTMDAIDDWQPPPKVIEIISDLKKEGRL